eukprot:3271404-Alexandrium_andersonii.AAC.1
MLSARTTTLCATARQCGLRGPDLPARHAPRSVPLLRSMCVCQHGRSSNNTSIAHDAQGCAWGEG